MQSLRDSDDGSEWHLDVTSDILLAEDNLIVKILEKYGRPYGRSLAVDALKAKEICLILFLYVVFHAGLTFYQINTLRVSNAAAFQMAILYNRIEA